MSNQDFASFLQRSLQVLAVEAPRAHSLILQKLGQRLVRLEIDGERRCVHALESRLIVSRSDEPPAAEARTSRAVLIRLLDADLDLLDAVLTEQVVLVGVLDDLVAFYEALLAYFGGAVRCPGFVPLLAEFLAAGAGSGRHASSSNSAPTTPPLAPADLTTGAPHV